MVVPVARLAIVGVLPVAAGIAFAALPARRAAAVDPLEAIATA